MNDPSARIDGALLDALVAFITRFVALTSVAQAHALALWVLHTWALDAAVVSPYIIVTSPEKRCGKSRLLDVLVLLVARAWRLDAPPTEAVLFRKIEADASTVLLDEADTLFCGSPERTEPLRAIFNSGNRRGGTVFRCVGKAHAIHGFSIFSPKLLAGIDAPRWPDTIRDRAIVIELRRKRVADAVERFRRRDVEPEALVLATACEEWASINSDQLTPARPNLPEPLNDRAADAWEPLLAIADLVGDHWPDSARSAALELSTAGKEEDDGSIGIRLLSDIHKEFNGEETLSTTMLLERLNALDDAPWGACRHEQGLDARGLARLLKRYEIAPKTVRLGETTLKGYTRADFADALSRYVPTAQEPSQASHVSLGTSGEERDVTDVTDVTERPTLALDFSRGAVNSDSQCQALHDRLAALGLAPEWIEAGAAVCSASVRQPGAAGHEHGQAHRSSWPDASRNSHAPGLITAGQQAEGTATWWPA